MASEALPAKYLDAAQEYLAAITKLGLRPSFLGWGRQITTGQWLLVLITSIIEAGGPLELNRLLFAAYNAGGTPKEISPFIVRIYSPEMLPIMQHFQPLHWVGKEVRQESSGASGKAQSVEFVSLDLTIDSQDAVWIDLDRQSTYQKRREEWSRFKHNVEKLAA
jgi:hypothetical protein